MKKTNPKRDNKEKEKAIQKLEARLRESAAE